MFTGQPSTHDGFLQSRHLFASCIAISGCQADVYLLQTGLGTIFSIQFRHLNTWDCHSLLASTPRVLPHWRLQQRPPKSSSQLPKHIPHRHSSPDRQQRVWLCSLLASDSSFLNVPMRLNILVPIHLITIEFRAINADKARLSTYRQSTSATHSRTIHHDGVQ